MKRTGSMLIGCALLALAAGTARAEVQRQAIIQEIQAAFDTWSQAPCVNLKFDYKGELTEYVSEKQGALLVYFGYDKSTWAQGDRAFHSGSFILDNTTGAIVRGVIGLNAYQYDWTIGQEKNKLDIRTAVTRLIPFAIGFYVGPDPKGSDLQGLIAFDFVDHSLDPLQVIGAQFDYFAPGGSCVKPGMPPVCGSSSWILDAGPAPEGGAAKDVGPADRSPLDLGARPDAELPMHLCIYDSNPTDPTKGAPYHWEGAVPWYLYLPNQGRIPGGVPVVETDAGAKADVGRPDVGGDGGGGSGGDGCCRLSHAGTGGAGGALLALALLALLVRARRRRR